MLSSEIFLEENGNTKNTSCRKHIESKKEFDGFLHSWASAGSKQRWQQKKTAIIKLYDFTKGDTEIVDLNIH